MSYCFQCHALLSREAFELHYAALTRQVYGAAKKVVWNMDVQGCGFVVTDAAQQPRACAWLYKNSEIRLGSGEAWCFGHFEAIEHVEAVQLLLSTIRAHAQKPIVGPMDGSTWEQYRLPMDGRQAAFFLDLEMPKYYAELLLQCHFQLLKTYYSHVDISLKIDEIRLRQKSEKLAELGIEVRSMDMHNAERELQAIYRFCCGAFRKNYLYTPISQERFIDKYLPAVQLTNSEFILIAEDQSGICGFLFALPDFMNKEQKGLIVKTLARKQAAAYTGVGTVLGACLYQRAAVGGYSYAIHAFMEEDNLSRRVSVAFSGFALRKYGLFFHN